jgi:ATP-dependent phosphofructokinase / diphosphate-dependent phosphofructokinase
MTNGELRDRSNEIIEGYHQLDLDALIGIGGDGSLVFCGNWHSRGELTWWVFLKPLIMTEDNSK